LDFGLRILDLKKMDEVGKPTVLAENDMGINYDPASLSRKTTIHGPRRTIHAGKRHVKNEAS
jgi:hypothetical protein